jgi:hypothetical protein
LREPFDCLLFSYSALLLLSCVVPCYQGTADTRRAGCSIRLPASRPSASSNVCMLYLVFKEPRTTVSFPADAPSKFPNTWILPRPFLGEPYEFTTTYLP